MAEAAVAAHGPPPPLRPPAVALAEVDAAPTPSGPPGLALRPGEVVLLEGPNGSGKTSLLRALAGLPSTLGPRSVRVQGMDPRLLEARDLAARVHLALQDPRDTLVGLTVEGEFRLRRLPTPPEVKPLRGRDVATLSSGEARRVSLAATASQGAPLLLLDEPAEGLDAEGQRRLLELVRRAASSGGAVVAADHTGLLRGLATRTLRLAPEPAEVAREVPLGGGPASPPVLTVPRQEVARGGRAVRLPDLRLGRGFHALAGPNGAGKSTLLLVCAGLLPGQAAVRDALPWPGVNVRLLLPRARDLFTAETVAEETRAVEPWARAFVPEALLARHPLTLSAGEAQRVALAKTLGRPASLVLLDEPEAHLDAAGRALLVQAIARRVREGACVLAATHDPALQALAETIVPMGDTP